MSKKRKKKLNGFQLKQQKIQLKKNFDQKVNKQPKSWDHSLVMEQTEKGWKTEMKTDTIPFQTLSDTRPILKDQWKYLLNTDQEIKDFSKRSTLIEELCRDLIFTDFYGNKMIFLSNQILGHRSILTGGLEECINYFSQQDELRTFNQNFTNKSYPKWTNGERYNHHYNREKTKREEQLLNKDWKSISENISIHNKNGLLSWLGDHYHEFIDDDPNLFKEVFKDGYTLNEIIRTNVDPNVLEDLVFHFNELVPKTTMNKEETLYFKDLPNQVKVYRGIGRTNYNDDNGELLSIEDIDIERFGYSWTTDKEKGEWFGTRYMEEGFLVEGIVDKDYISCYWNGREEHEVIIDPTFIKNIKITDLSGNEPPKYLDQEPISMVNQNHSDVHTKMIDML